MPISCVASRLIKVPCANSPRRIGTHFPAQTMAMAKSAYITTCWAAAILPATVTPRIALSRLQRLIAAVLSSQLRPCEEHGGSRSPDQLIPRRQSPYRFHPRLQLYH